MDKQSQSSDVFPDSGDHYEYSVSHNTDIDSFSTLVSNTKMTLADSIENVVLQPNFSAQFTSAVEDCETCIAQGLDLVTNLLSDQSLQLEKLQELIEDIVTLLQRLSNYLKNVVQSVSMECCHYAIFPIATGHILLTVFTHCRDSETLYGHYLKHVENELKNLFKACHELQVTYLMILDKRFTFELSNCEEIDILLEALETNLKIGEIVQSLDVKTMAEQWKGFTILCEKYAASLIDKNIFVNCVKILCSMTENNINTAVEIDQEDKVAVRSVKVASFTVKILLKVYNIFKQATVKNFEHVLDLLLYVFLNSCSSLQMTAKKSPEFINLMVSNVSTPCEMLLKELLLDQHFINTLFSYDIENQTKEDQRLGYCLLMMSVIKLTLQGNLTVSKKDLINCVYRFLPYGHIWFNIGLKLSTGATNDKDTYGLYEHLLSHAYALATTLGSEEMLYLEDAMFAAVLGVDCYSALFSVNLWSLIAKISTRQYLRSQISCLWKACEELDEHDYIPNGWHQSPQRVHLNHLLRKLIEILSTDKKDSSFGYQCLRLASKDIDLTSTVGDTWTGLNKTFETIFSSAEQAPKLIRTLNNYTRIVAPPCDIKEKSTICETIVVAWMKACPNQNNFILDKIQSPLDSESALYLDYVRSLASITMSLELTSFSEVEQIKILHVVSSLIQHGNTEMKSALTNLLLELAANIVPGRNAHIVESILVLTFRSLFQENDIATRETFYNALRKRKQNSKVANIITNVITDDDKLQRIWDQIMSLKTSDINTISKENFQSTIHLKYVHKCVENLNEEVIELGDSDSGQDLNKTNSNFDFADIDTLFEADSDSEPACKKVRLNTPDKQTNELRDIITRLENDTEHLCQIKENVFNEEYKSRIRAVCVKLQGIVL